MIKPPCLCFFSFFCRSLLAGDSGRPPTDRPQYRLQAGSYIPIKPEQASGVVDPTQINILVGTKKQPAQSVGAHHVVLNGADGLEFLTLVDCSLVFVARKGAILRSAGSVTFNRRQEIQRKVRAFLGLG